MLYNMTRVIAHEPACPALNMGRCICRGEAWLEAHDALVKGLVTALDGGVSLNGDRIRKALGDLLQPFREETK